MGRYTNMNYRSLSWQPTPRKERLKKLSEICEIVLEMLPECDSPHEHLDDEGLAKDLEDRLEQDVTAWFCAKVSAEVGGVVGDAEYLGYCSYDSEEQFRNDGYFADMKKQATENLLDAIDRDRETIEKILGTIGKP